jgi:L-amino acid N-acyltransferase YncA
MDLIRCASEHGRAVGLKTLFAIVLEHNMPSRCLLEKAGFALWGFLPSVADFGDFESGHCYYGLKLNSPN